MRHNFHLILFLISLPLLCRAKVNSSENEIEDMSKISDPSIDYSYDAYTKQTIRSWQNYESSTRESYAAYEERSLRSWAEYQRRIKKKWVDGAIPEQKVYVQYFNDDTTRIKVDYEKGVLSAETLMDSNDQSENAKKKIKTAITSFVGNNNSEAVIDKDEIGNSSVDNAKATNESTVAEDKKPRIIYRINLPLVPDFILKRVKKFKPIIDTWANKHNIDPAYVLAIIRQESSFNPKARSWVPALGLMQIVPHYAGQEVLKAVTGKNIKPDEGFLYDPAKNIMVGVTYLQILRDQYFPNVKDKTKQMYLITASYNWGPHRIQKAIKRGVIPGSASSDETFDIIQKIAPNETRGYVRKVVEYYAEFKKMGY